MKARKTPLAINIKLDQDVATRLEFAWRRDLSCRSRSDFIRSAVIEKLDRIEKEGQAGAEKNNLFQGMAAKPGKGVSCQRH